MPFNLNGTTIQKLVLNGVEVDNAYLNGVKVFTASPEVGDYYNGGTYLGDLDGYRYIWSGLESDDLTQSDAKTYCENLQKDGYEDWFLPTRGELLWMAIKPMLIPAIKTWSSTNSSSLVSYMVDTANEVSSTQRNTNLYPALPIRKEEI
ncbi:MAG: hypothetical protein RBR45_14130 [Pseudomonas sp.]|nr:hypothetical protein [Pseudomonas sp.]